MEQAVFTPKLERRRTQQEQIEAIQKYPDMNLYRRCVDEGAVVKIGARIFETDKDKVIAIYEDFRDQIVGRTKKWNDNGNSFQYPADFDPTKAVKEGAQEVVKILHDSGQVDLQTIRGAARFAGPGNVIYVENQSHYILSLTDEFHSWREKHADLDPSEDKFGKTYQYPPGPRSRYMKVEIGGVGLRNKSARNIEYAQTLGIDLTPEQAVMLEIVGGYGHEYGHAIKRGLDNQGLAIEEQAKNMGLLQRVMEVGIHPLDVDQIFDERFACSIERILNELYLQKLGIPPVTVKQFFGQDDAILNEVTDAALSLHEYLGQKGYSADDVGGLELEVISAIHALHESDQLWRVWMLLSYASVPWTQDQIKYLVDRGS